MLGILQWNPKCVKRSVLEEGRAQRQCIRGYHAYMIIWKPLVGKCLQHVKEPISKVNKNSVSVIRTDSHCKVEVAGLAQQKSP